MRIQEPKVLPKNEDSAKGSASLMQHFKEWSKRISYYSVLSAVPGLVIGNPQEIRAEDQESGNQAIARDLSAQVRRRSSRPRVLGPAFRELRYSKDSILTGPQAAGSDNCPGTSIPVGSYTEGSPFVDTDDTTGGDNTVNDVGFYYGYYNASAFGSDRIYSFVVDGFGPSPRITITTSSPTYRPMLYVSDRCPSGTNNFIDWLNNYGMNDSRWTSGNTATVFLGHLRRGGRYYAYVDSSVATDSGPYTFTLKDLQTRARASLRTNHPDYDGDGKTDISVWRPSEGNWYILQSQNQNLRVHGWGLPGDKLAPADFDGDGRTDLAVFRENEGNWYILNSESNTVSIASWGMTGDLLVPADYTGDLKADLAVFRPSNGTWYRRDSDGVLRVTQWGLAGDRPMAADLGTDGIADMTVFRPSTSQWFVLVSGFRSVHTFGEPGDIPVPGDYNGWGWSQFAVYRPANQTWYRWNGSDAITWGLPGDLPAPGDYDGDGKMDIAVFRPSNGTWYIIGSSAGIVSQPFGLTGDIPTPTAFVY